MKAKIIARQDRIVELLVEGKTVFEIAEKIEVNEKTVRRDIKMFQDRMPEKKNEAFVRLLATKERLMRDAVLLYEECKSDKARINCLLLQSKLIESLEKTYDRFGLMPNLNEIDRMHGKPTFDLSEMFDKLPNGTE